MMSLTFGLFSQVSASGPHGPLVNKSVPNNYISHLKSDNIENSRIDLKEIILQVPSNQIKVTFIITLFVIFSCFT